MDGTVTFGMVVATLIALAAGAVFVAHFVSELRRAKDDAAKIERRLAQASGIPRVSHAQMIRDFAEHGDRREAELRARFGDKGAA